ncbi:MAG: hypothetical protein ACFB2W_22495 [Leptolyngbyaceae cyanobacterium]
MHAAFKRDLKKRFESLEITLRKLVVWDNDFFASANVLRVRNQATKKAGA